MQEIYLKRDESYRCLTSKPFFCFKYAVLYHRREFYHASTHMYECRFYVCMNVRAYMYPISFFKLTFLEMQIVFNLQTPAIVFKLYSITQIKCY